MDEHPSQLDWNRVAAQWPQIGELVGGCRDRAHAHRLLVAELKFDPSRADQVLDLRVADLVQFARPQEQMVESEAHEHWQVRGRDFTPHEFRREERVPWSLWIREGVENNWLNVVRLREPGILTALSRTNDDRSIYVEHRSPSADALIVHTAIGMTYADGDETLFHEIVDGMIRSKGRAVDDDAITRIRGGPIMGCLVQLDGTEIAARALIAQGWWSVGVAIDPITNTYITGQGDEVPELDLVTVKSFDELDDQTSTKPSPT